MPAFEEHGISNAGKGRRMGEQSYFHSAALSQIGELIGNGVGIGDFANNARGHAGGK